MVKVIVLLVVECCGIVLIRSKAWKDLLRQVSENRIPTKRAKGVAASLIRTSGHLWLLLGFVPIAVLVMTFVSVEELDAPSAELLAVSALGLTAWCGWNAVHHYRWAWRVSKLDVGED
jgi:hypothetical protein